MTQPATQSCPVCHRERDDVDDWTGVPQPCCRECYEKWRSEPECTCYDFDGAHMPGCPMRGRKQPGAACRRCLECVGEEHHWLTSMPECPEDGEPFIPCKHCDARAAVCDECCEAPVWPIVSNQPLCADCRLGEGVE